MFRRQENGKSSSSENFTKYIEGRDVFNSYLIYKLGDPSLTKVSYVVTRYEYRPDLIAKDIYGSSDYTGVLMSQCRLSLDGYTKGRVLRIIPKADIDRIISNIITEDNGSN